MKPCLQPFPQQHLHPTTHNPHARAGSRANVEILCQLYRSQEGLLHWRANHRAISAHFKVPLHCQIGIKRL